MDFATRLVNLLHSCGWIKTEVFENDYNMVVDTSKKIMSMLYKRWLTIFRQYGVLGWIRVKTIILLKNAMCGHAFCLFILNKMDMGAPKL